MKLPIAQMAEGENRYHFDSVRDGWVQEFIRGLQTSGYRFGGDFNLDIQLTKLEPNYYLRGKMAFQIDQACARCAEIFPLPIRHSFEMGMAHLSHKKGQKADFAEEAAEMDELDMIYFEGQEIALGPVFEEQFVLSLPYHVVCKENCQGICQRCGKNLNLGPCGCHETFSESPFSILKQLKQ